MDNHRKSKEIKIHKINFKNAKRYSIYKRRNKKNSYTPCLSQEKKNSIQNSSINNLIKKIEDKYCMMDKNNILKGPRRNKSSNKLIVYKFNNNPFLKQKSIKKIDEEKNNNCTTNETPMNIKNSQTKEENKKRSSKDLLKRCKTVCNNNKNLKTNEKEQDTNNNLNINKSKKGKNDKKLGKKKTINKTKDQDAKIEEKGKVENLTKNIKNKFLCCFLL